MDSERGFRPNESREAAPFRIYTDAELQEASVEQLKFRAQELRGILTQTEEDRERDRAYLRPDDWHSREREKSKHSQITTQLKGEIERIEHELLGRPQ